MLTPSKSCVKQCLKRKLTSCRHNLIPSQCELDLLFRSHSLWKTLRLNFTDRSRSFWGQYSSRDNKHRCSFSIDFYATCFFPSGGLMAMKNRRCTSVSGMSPCGRPSPEYTALNLQPVFSKMSISS